LFINILRKGGAYARGGGRVRHFRGAVSVAAIESVGPSGNRCHFHREIASWEDTREEFRPRLRRLRRQLAGSRQAAVCGLRYQARWAGPAHLQSPVSGRDNYRSVRGL